ncbi:MAG: ABC transporter substrate-binding protein [Geminicoccaceae bacterium]|nr:ABC transporter substrate-binding protein [Geminicoccaceae bacterium]
MAHARAETPDAINVACFLEWPTANRVAKEKGWYEEALGTRVDWRAFDTGTVLSAAMASGDVRIACGQGLVPFTVAVSQGLPIEAVGIAASHAENDNCVVREGAGVTEADAAGFAGKPIAVPFGTDSHFKLLRMLDPLGVDPNAARLIDMAPADGYAALARGDVVMACGWGGALKRRRRRARS